MGEVPLYCPYRGTSPIRKCPPPWDPFRTPGIGLRHGPRGLSFMSSEVPLLMYMVIASGKGGLSSKEAGHGGRVQRIVIDRMMSDRIPYVARSLPPN